MAMAACQEQKRRKMKAKRKREREREKSRRAARIDDRDHRFPVVETNSHEDEPLPVVDFYHDDEDDGVDGGIFQLIEHGKSGKGKLLPYSSDASSSDDYSYGGLESHELNRSKEIYRMEFNKRRKKLSHEAGSESGQKQEAHKKKETKTERKQKKSEGEDGPLPFDHRDLWLHQTDEDEVVANISETNMEAIVASNGTSAKPNAEEERVLPNSHDKGSNHEMDEDDIVINILQPVKQEMTQSYHEKLSNDETEEDDMVINIALPVNEKGVLSNDCKKQSFPGIKEDDMMINTVQTVKIRSYDQKPNSSSQHILDLQNGSTVIHQPKEAKKEKKEKRKIKDKEANEGKQELKQQHTTKLENEKKEKLNEDEMKSHCTQKLEKGKTEKKERKEKKGKIVKEDQEKMEPQFTQKVEKEKKERKGKEKAKFQFTEEADNGVKSNTQFLGSPKTLFSRPTISIAVAGSIVDNAQSLELATILAGQIARAAAVFRVDEIVVFDDYDGATTQDTDQNGNLEGGLFMVKILEYLEVPQYLRRALIPMHRSLSSVGKLPPLDAPHHLRKHERKPFREGVVVDHIPSPGSGSYVDVGLDKEVLVAQSLKAGTRVTVSMGNQMNTGDVLQVVDRETVRQSGQYWGYTVRYASCLSAVFDECPFESKYDYYIGTSEHGERVRSSDLFIPKFRHLLIAFGGLSGLEESTELDKKIKAQCVTSLFDQYLNTCPNQGSRTIRTEEAILISLQFLQEAIEDAMRRP